MMTGRMFKPVQVLVHALIDGKMLDQNSGRRCLPCLMKPESFLRVAVIASHY